MSSLHHQYPLWNNANSLKQPHISKMKWHRHGPLRLGWKRDDEGMPALEFVWRGSAVGFRRNQRNTTHDHAFKHVMQAYQPLEWQMEHVNSHITTGDLPQYLVLVVHTSIACITSLLLLLHMQFSWRCVRYPCLMICAWTSVMCYWLLGRTQEWRARNMWSIVNGNLIQMLGFFSRQSLIHYDVLFI